MMQKLKKIFQRAAFAVFEPIVEKFFFDNLYLGRQIQILLSLIYRGSGNIRNEMLEFEEIGFNVFTENYEDGILLYIFSLIGTTNKKCVDIGCGTIKNSNVANLIINHGFNALLIDGNSKNIKLTKDYYQNRIETKYFFPKLITKMVTCENINNILVQNGFEGDIDLLSIDIDGIDYWIWKSIASIKPRVVVVEFQCILGPSRSWTVPYIADFNVNEYAVNNVSFNYCGASLMAFVKLAKQKGYRLVGCNRGGWNAFFLKNGCGETYFPEIQVTRCFKFEWNHMAREKRFQLVKDMEWEEV